MGGRSDGRIRELAMAIDAHFLETRGEQKTAVVKSRDQVLHQLADFELARGLGERQAQVQIGLFAVKAAQRLNERRRNDERRIRIAERIAQHQPRPLGNRRRQELDVVAKTWKLLRHGSIISARSRTQRSRALE